MGVDTRAMCMVGKYFEDADACVDYLQENKLLTKEQVLDYIEDGFEAIQDFLLQYQDISCYSEEGGYLGLSVPNSIDISHFQETVDAVKEILGEDVGLHNFVYWY